MSQLPRIAVTGVTGFIGGAVARQLAERGIAQRLLVRDPSRAPQVEGGAVLPFSFADRAAAEAALAGAEVLLMVSASESADRLDHHRAFVDAAAAAGVQHIVYTSFVGAARDATFTLVRDHFATEEYIKRSGVDYTFLRDSLYLDFMENLVGADGNISGPAGDGRVGMVARRDVARTAATVLTDPGPHAGVHYDLTGPESLTLAEAAQIIATARGHAISFHNETLEEAYASRASYGAPDWEVAGWVTTYAAIANGDLDKVSDDVARVAGHPPVSLAEFLRDNPASYERLASQPGA